MVTNKKVIILAAGLGTRMGNKGKIVPKCLIKINHKTLLERKIELFKKYGLTDIFVVIGAKGNCWTQENVDKIKKLCGKTIVNFDNDTTNNTFSLHLGLNGLKECDSDLLIIDGDLVFDEKTLKEILNQEGKTIILSEKAKEYSSPGNKVLKNHEDKIIAIGRELNPEKNYFPWDIYSGLMKIDKKDVEKLKEECKKEEYSNKDTGVMLNNLCKITPIHSINPDSEWANINNQEELRRIEKIITEEDKENILVTGASGFLGKKIFDKLSKHNSIYGIYSSNKKSGEFLKADITDRASLREIVKKVNPKVIIHAAALCNADFCEENREIAYNVNVSGTQNVIDICKEYGIKLIFLSSDYVYDGDNPEYNEDSIAKPVNYYGETKLICERIIKEQLKNYVILRPTILYGFNDEEDKATYVTKIINKLKNNEEVSVDDSVKKYPLLIDDLVSFIQEIIKKGFKGDFNIGTEKAYTRYEWAIKIAEVFNLDKNLLKPKKSENIAKKPNNVLYDLSKLKKFGFEINSLENGLKIMKNQIGCMFRLIYNSRPDKKVNGESVSLFRKNVGKQLAKDDFIEADMVIGIPDSGVYGALGYSEESKIPIHFGIVRDEYSRRTLINESPQLRSEKLREKLVVIRDIVKNKNVVLIDEAILSGKTLKVAIEKLKSEGVNKIHVRIPSPVMLENCYNNILEKNAELVAGRISSPNKEIIEEKLKEHFKVDSLKFLSMESFLNCLENNNDNFCFECFRRKIYNN